MKKLTDQEVEQEIERLKNTEAVKLSLSEQKMRYKRRQYLYTLRWHEKHGKELMESGITEQMIQSMEMETAI